MMRTLFSVLLVFVVACEPTSDTDALDDFCAASFDCFEFDDADQCVDVWLDPSNPDTTCANEADYLDCAVPCTDKGCGADLNRCEDTCWTTHCTAS